MSTIEELINIARSEKPKTKKEKVSEIQKKRTNQVNRFIASFNVTSGEEKFPTFVVYRNYKRWAKIHCDQIIGKTEFFRIFGRSFKSGRNGNFRYYLLRTDNIDNSKKAREEARKYDKECK